MTQSENLWQARTEALAHLQGEKPAQLALVEALYDTVDSCIDVFEAHSRDDVYARVCGLTLLKAKHLAIGAYSLILDGLGQEAGALIRPFIEYAELLTYFRNFPNAVIQALEGGLPKAGERAKAIDGIYKEFREHLNLHASHSSYSKYALAHLLEPSSFRFKKMQRMVPSVLERNLLDFTVQLYLLLHEAVLALEPSDDAAFQRLGGEVDTLKVRILDEWSLNAT